MPSYVVTGVSRGIGVSFVYLVSCRLESDCVFQWEFLSQLSNDPNNTVIGLVRNKPGTDKRVAKELPGRSNITILEADLTKYDAIKVILSSLGTPRPVLTLSHQKAAADAAIVTGGSLDYLIANAGYVAIYDFWDGIGTLWVYTICDVVRI